MKKKILTAVLSVFMILSSSINAVHAEILTVKDVFDTFSNPPVSPGRDTDDIPIIPSIAWVEISNDVSNQDSYLLISENKICITAPGWGQWSFTTQEINQLNVEKAGDNYKVHTEANYSTSGIDLIFTMNAGVLESISVSGYPAPGQYYSYFLDGTYVPPNFQTIADILPSDFPTTKQDGWVNQSNGTNLYLSGDSLLHSNEVFNVSKDSTIVSNGLNFQTNSLDFTINFIMSGLDLSYIEIVGYNDAHSVNNVDGVYKIPKTLNDILPNDDLYMWQNDKGAMIFRNSDTLEFSSFEGDEISFSNICLKKVTPVFGKQYQYELNTDGVLFKFKVNDEEKINSFEIEGCGTVVFNGTYVVPKTIADILPDDFPIEEGSGITGNLWKNRNGMSLYLIEEYNRYYLKFIDPGNENLYLDTYETIDRAILFKLGNTYLYQTDVRYDWDNWGECQVLMTFNMNNDYLENVDITLEFAYGTPDNEEELRKFEGKYGIPVTVAFDTIGHGSISGQTVPKGSKIVEPSKPTASGYTFGGWYKDNKYTDAFNFAIDTISSSCTLYAKWISNNIDSANISGNITEDSAAVPNAKVELRLGVVKVAATASNSSGYYSFDSVETGTYDIVAINDDGKTKTEMITVDTPGNITIDVELPIGDVNSLVEYQDNSVTNTKSIPSHTVAGGLDIVAENAVQVGNKITIKLKVMPKKEGEVSCATEIKQKAGNDKKVEFIDLDLLKQINNGVEQSIGDSNDRILTIIIPFDFTNTDVESIKILRKHNTNDAEELTNNPSLNCEGYKINNDEGIIIVYAKKFSNYAIAYKNSGSNPSGPTPEYKVPNTGIKGTNNHYLLKLSSLSLFAVGAYMVIKKKKDN